MSWRDSVGFDLPAPQDIFPSFWVTPSPFFYALEDMFNRCSRPQLTMAGGKLRLTKEHMISQRQIEHCYPTKTVQCFLTLLWCSLAIFRWVNKTLLWYKTYRLHYTKKQTQSQPQEHNTEFCWAQTTLHQTQSSSWSLFWTDKTWHREKIIQHDYFNP